jgi:AraC-like DNA-binding protein
MPYPIYIKNMVCDRCKGSVEAILKSLDIPYGEIKLGEVGIERLIDTDTKSELSKKLSEAGFELLEDRDSRLINQIKSEVIRFVQNAKDFTNYTLSGHLSVHLNKEYSTLSKLFSTVEGRTIEQYYIQQRIEKAKELVTYDELTLSEIAFKLGYSSVAHLSAQFKKITGMTPTVFKKLGMPDRKKLDEI